ncbi:unnamed protein product [Orchesella dallaii]|uniref:alpha-glucosidase n=1 Tax=Orchesella dallaii TaxID=48710 RepID=A0ABP1QM17_9HEXA
MAHFRVFTFLLLLSNGLAIKLPENPNPQPLAWWQEDIIYQVYPRSLMDSDGDGVGDLKGIESKIDHFVDIGVGSVWLSPIYESPMKDFGYDISNFTNVDPIFGTMEDFTSLSNALKEKGLKLVMDFVPNHSSDLHVWFNKSIHREGKYEDFYVWRDPKGFDDQGNPILPNNWISSFGGSAWEWNEVRQQFYLHQFVAGQPDFNYENPEVLKEMLAAMKFWLDLGVDGFRLDTVPSMFEDQRFLDEPEDPNRPPESIPSDHGYWLHIYTYDLPATREALAEYRKLLDIYSLSDGRERCMMVEAYVNPLEKLFLYYGTKEKPVAHFPFNFEFIKRVTRNFNGTDIVGVIDEWFEKMPEGNTANWLVGNHDQWRIASRFTPEDVDAFNMLIMLLPGSMVTYYGEEIGMTNANISWEDTVDPAGCQAGPDRYQLFSRDPERTPMQWTGEEGTGFTTGNTTWLPINPNYRELNVQAQNETTGDSHLKVYKRISALRKTDTWRYGSLEAKAIDEGAAFGYSRIYQGKGFVYLANYVNSNTTINVGQEFEGIPAQATVYTTSVNFQPETAVGSSISTGSVTISGKHSIILEF